MSNYNYDALKTMWLSEEQLLQLKKVSKVSWFLHMHKLEYSHTVFSICFLFVIEKQITSELLIVFRKVLQNHQLH